MPPFTAGDTLLIWEPSFQKAHLWFMLTDEYSEPPRVLAVMLRTRTRFTDDTVLLAPGDHPFIRHESAVHYSTSCEFLVSALSDWMASGTCHRRQRMSGALLARVRKGLVDSVFSKNAYRDRWREEWGGQ